jgi:hypothetical protein
VLHECLLKCTTTTSMTTYQENWTKKLGTDAVALGAITVTGYAFAYMFEMGFARHFGYARYLIEPTIATLASSLILLFILAYGILPILVVTLHSSTPERTRLISVFLVVSFVWFMAQTVALIGIDKRSILAGVFLLISGWVFLSGLRSNNPMFLEKINRVKITILILIVIANLLITAFLTGAYSGKRMKKFDFFSNDPRYAVVRMYGQTMIAIKYDFSKQEFLKEYKVLKLPDGENGVDFTEVKLMKKRALLND